MAKIIKWIKNLFRWRFHYTKTKITTEETNRDRSIIYYEVGIREIPNDKSKPIYSEPICSKHKCLYKWNERFIIKFEKL